jgi:membrane-bound ClpP family serine protease
LRPAADGYRDDMIITGLILLLIGAVAGIGILWTVGVVLVVVGAVLMLLGRTGHAVAGRNHYW